MSLVRRFTQVRVLAGMAGRTLLDTLYPLECGGCGSSGKIICNACAEDLPKLVPPFCQVCAAAGDFARCGACAENGRRFDGIRAPFRYSGGIRRAILALKYGGIKAAAPQLGDMMGEYLSENPVPGNLLVPVPMHPRRRRERGYNQAELLARRVADRCNLRYEPGLLQRSRHVDPQAGIRKADQRRTNVAGSVAVGSAEDVAGTRIILVDDVATTGSTMEAAADALKRAGAVSVWGLTLAVSSGDSLAE